MVPAARCAAFVNPAPRDGWNTTTMVRMIQPHRAELMNLKGVKQGYLAGSIFTVDLQNDNPSDQLRERSLNFQLPKGTILARGISSYPPNDRELRPNAPVVIAVIGGTGAYIGASGEVTTTRLTDGSYQQVITLVE